MGEMRGLRTLLGQCPRARVAARRCRRGATTTRSASRSAWRRCARLTHGAAQARAVRGRIRRQAVRGHARHRATTTCSSRPGSSMLPGARYRDWPAYTAEDLLALDPEWIVTSIGMGQLLCRRPGLDRLRACGERRRDRGARRALERERRTADARRRRTALRARVPGSAARRTREGGSHESEPAPAPRVHQQWRGEDHGGGSASCSERSAAASA